MTRVVIFLMATVLVLTGCGKSSSEKLAEKMIEKGMGKDGIKGDVNISDGKVSITGTDREGKKFAVDQSGESVTIKSQDGTATFSTGPSARLPEGFPKDVYVLDGAKVVTAMTVPEGFSVVLQAKDGADKVAASYKARMTGNGWTEESAFTTPQHTMAAYKKDDRSATVMIMPAEGETQVTLSVMTAQE